MLLPSFLYGPYREVKPRCRKLVTQLRRGAAWSELATDFIDTKEVAGLLVLRGPSPLMPATPQFHCFAPLRTVEESIPERLSEEFFSIIFHESLKTLWGVLGLVSNGGQFFIWKASRAERQVFLQAVLRYWDEFESVGERYSYGSTPGENLWSIPTTIQYCLANEGVPDAKLNAPLPPGGLKELIQLAQA